VARPAAAAALRRWTVGGCIASGARAAAAWWSAAVVGHRRGRSRANVFLLGVANGAFSIAAIGSMMATRRRRAEPAREGARMGLWGAAQAIGFGDRRARRRGRQRPRARWLHRLARSAAYGSVFLAEAAAVRSPPAAARRRAIGQRGRIAGAMQRPRTVPHASTPAATCRDLGGETAMSAACTTYRRGGRRRRVRPAPRPPTTWRAPAAAVLLLDRAGRIKPCGGADPAAR
jgi:hypothetical protein